MAGARGPIRRPLVSRLFGRRNRRRGPEQGRRVAFSVATIVRAATVAMVLAAALVTWPWVRAAVRGHPYFAVREVVVRGQSRMAPDAIRVAADIEPGMPVWDVDCDRAENLLAREPWVRSARVRRWLPHRIVIQVREEQPVAILVASSSDTRQPSRLYYVGPHGRVCAPVGPTDPRDLPYLTGIELRQLETADGAGSRLIRRALGLLRLASRTGEVSEINVDRARGLTLLPVRPTVPVEIGWGQLAEKLSRLPEVMARWRGRETEVAAISLIFRDEVIVRTRSVPTPAVPRRAARS